ncbi:MAG: flagellar hook-associated protein FlgL, partial [Acidimicrobiia bacterium]|nr:flagellar hook-associated protein FlgL [Acidimicrobiia bacterium]
MAMRVTNRMMVDLAVQRLNTRIGQFERSQRDLATGRRIHVASDDVAGMNTAMGLRAALAANSQAQRNAHDGVMLTEMADSRLGTMVEQLQRVRELAVLGSTDTANGAELDAMAAEVAEIRESLESLANARVDGRPLFSGFQPGKAVEQIAGTWTYVGDTGSVTRRVSEADVVAVNVTGGEAFGFSAGEDVFTMLDNLEADLRAENRPAVNGSIDALDRAMDRVLSARSTLGAAANRIEKALFRAQSDEVAFRTTLSETEDTDMAKAIMELQ